MALAMPRLFAERFGMLPLRVAGSRILYLGFAEWLDACAAFAAEQMSELKVECGVVGGAQFEAARSRLLGCDGVEMKLEVGEDKDAMAARITAILEQKQPIASRLVRLHQYYWLRTWLESGATGKAGSLPMTSEDVMDNVFTVGDRGVTLVLRGKKRWSIGLSRAKTNVLSGHEARCRREFRGRPRQRCLEHCPGQGRGRA